MPTQMNPTKYLKGSCQQCDGHIEYPAEMAGLTTTCPHCGQPTELLLATPREEPSISRRGLLWTTAAILILGLGLLGAIIALKRAQRLVIRQKQQAEALVIAARVTNSAASVEPDITSAGQGDLIVSGIQLQKSLGTSLVYAVGTVKNSSRRQRFGVKVELALLDARGQRIGAATDYRPVLEPGGQWQFKALAVDSKAVSAKLDSIKEEQ